MASFSYVARDSAGSLRQGTQEAPSSAELAAQLRQQGLLVVKVEAERQPSAGGGFGLGRVMPVRSVDIEIGLKQLAVMLRAGITLLEALRVLPRQHPRARVRRLWSEVAERIQSGSSFADALAGQRAISPLIVQLVRVGEQTGELERVLVRGAEALERRRRLRASVLSAFLYPTIVFVMTLGVTAFLVLNVLPKIRTFLSGLGRQLPPLTQALLDVSDFVQAHLVTGAVGLPLVLAGIFAIYLYPPGRLAIDRLILFVPLAGRVSRLSGTVSLARGLGDLLASGITLLESLSTTERLIGNRYLAERLARARERVLVGAPLHEQLTDPRAFTPMLSAMVAVGETSGSLDEVLAEVADFHEEELQGLVQTLSVLIEPAVIVAVGAVVGFVYLAVFMALYAAQGG
ncbi:MAG TPA: type II secretion system F family protein [Planctomycetes bacterium]|nr:type II secretion system F family protein [Planctomycetota bacterium]